MAQPIPRAVRQVPGRQGYLIKLGCPGEGLFALPVVQRAGIRAIPAGVAFHFSQLLCVQPSGNQVVALGWLHFGAT